MENKKDMLLFNIENIKVKHEFQEKELLELIPDLIFLKDDEEIISVDEYHIYCNNQDFYYAYDGDGGIYEFNNLKRYAKLIDSLMIIRKR